MCNNNNLQNLLDLQCVFHDALWFGSDTNTNCVVVYNLYLSN